MTGDQGLQRWLDANPAPYRLPLDTGSYEDYSDQRPRLSKAARRAQRRPLPIRLDEYGYDQRGRYWGEPDEVAS